MSGYIQSLFGGEKSSSNPPAPATTSTTSSPQPLPVNIPQNIGVGSSSTANGSSLRGRATSMSSDHALYQTVQTLYQRFKADNFGVSKDELDFLTKNLNASAYPDFKYLFKNLNDLLPPTQENKDKLLQACEDLLCFLHFELFPTPEPLKPNHPIKKSTVYGEDSGQEILDGFRKQLDNTHLDVIGILKKIVNGTLCAVEDKELKMFYQALISFKEADSNANPRGSTRAKEKIAFFINWFKSKKYFEKQQFSGILNKSEINTLLSESIDLASVNYRIELIDKAIAGTSGTLSMAFALLNEFLDKKILKKEDGAVSQLIDQLLSKLGNGAQDVVTGKPHLYLSAVLSHLNTFKNILADKDTKKREKLNIPEIQNALKTLLENEETILALSNKNREEKDKIDTLKNLRHFAQVLEHMGELGDQELLSELTDAYEEASAHYRMQSGIVTRSVDEVIKAFELFAAKLTTVDGFLQKNLEPTTALVTQVGTVLTTVKEILEINAKADKEKSKDPAAPSTMQQLPNLITQLQTLIPDLTKPLDSGAAIAKNMKETVEITSRPDPSGRDPALTIINKGVLPQAKKVFPLAGPPLASVAKITGDSLAMLQEMAKHPSDQPGALDKLNTTTLPTTLQIVTGLDSLMGKYVAPLWNKFNPFNQLPVLPDVPSSQNSGEGSSSGMSIPLSSPQGSSNASQKLPPHQTLINLYRALEILQKDVTAKIRHRHTSLYDNYLHCTLYNVREALKALVNAQKAREVHCQLSEQEVDRINHLVNDLAIALFNKQLATRGDLQAIADALTPVLQTFKSRVHPAQDTPAGQVLEQIMSVFTSAFDQSTGIMNKTFFSFLARNLFNVIETILAEVPRDNPSLRKLLESLAMQANNAALSGESSSFFDAAKTVYERLNDEGLYINNLKLFGKTPTRTDRALHLKNVDLNRKSAELLHGQSHAPEQNKKIKRKKLEKMTREITRNVSAQITLQQILGGKNILFGLIPTGCGLPIVADSLYKNIYKANQEGPRQASENLRTFAFEMIDRQNFFFLKRIWIKTLYISLAWGTKSFLRGFFENVVNTAKTYIDGHASNKFTDLKNKTIKNAQGLLGTLNGTYDEYAKGKEIPVGDKPHYFADKLSAKRLNQGFSPEELYKTVSDTAIDQFSPQLHLTKTLYTKIKTINFLPGRFLAYPVGAVLLPLTFIFEYLLPVPFTGSSWWTLKTGFGFSSVFNWGQKKFLRENHMIETMITKSIKATQDNEGYNHTFTSIVHDKLLTFWEEVQKGNNIQGGETQEAVSATKIHNFTRILHNWFEILKKENACTQNRLAQSNREQTIVGKIKQEFDDLVTTGVVDGAVAKLAHALAKMTKKEQFEDILLNALSSMNRPFTETKKETLDQKEKMEKDTEELFEMIVNHFITETIQENFNSGVKNHQKKIDEALETIKTDVDLYYREAKRSVKKLNRAIRIQDDRKIADSLDELISMRETFYSINRNTYVTAENKLFGHTKALLQEIDTKIGNLSNALERSLNALSTQYDQNRNLNQGLNQFSKDLDTLQQDVQNLPRIIVNNIQPKLLQWFLEQAQRHTHGIIQSKIRAGFKVFTDPGIQEYAVRRLALNPFIEQFAPEVYRNTQNKIKK
jgi:hypothetical protein